MPIRLAEPKDIKQLVKMRWDFTLETSHNRSVIKEASYCQFENECEDFLIKALESRQWAIWVAESEGQIISHIYIELVEKVPRPGRITRPFAFMTNVYTLPDYRGEGVGSQLLSCVNDWAKQNRYEFIIVWPSEESIPYYKKNGYSHAAEPMEYFPL
ncbi:GNAT family N-acetyltransferase [Salipaludibacillus aurantiacus]|uniref:Acetyltransferase (GNAT) domain-containing protein n=1 Tax=Salipaludibacillus aurantiacus TaxID=1601833 RepID=A0A1H9QDD9_9BACI|nr:GNAT family N-acetyltransferase [Salipaludibacillus aurantiacus]SER57823.1 Acetyltransferase (GNAT) domain-containing protein [Salipaludibacillus aurantiacus]